MSHTAHLGATALAMVAAVAATVATTPASAQPYQVIVQLADGATRTVVLDLPPGSTLGDLGGVALPGTPIALQELSSEPAVAEPPPDETPPAEPVEQEPPEEPVDEAPADEDPADEEPPPAPPDEPVQEDPANDKPGGEPDAPTAGDPPAPKPPAAPAPVEAPARKHSPVIDTQPDATPVPERQHGFEPTREPAGDQPPLRNTDGTATRQNPGFVDGLAGPWTTTEVPNFIIRKFRVPPFLLPIYQAAGTEYGVRWEILAAINEIETDYGRDLNVSSAGALGWMQFMPSTWRAYGVDGNRDGRKDPYNPVDAIFAAARYLKAAGYEEDVRRAIFAYNHADWYVDSVLLRARLIAGIPADLIGSLTGLTEARFPVRGHVTYADDVAESTGRRRSVDIFAAEGTSVIAVNDGVIETIGRSGRLGRYVVLEDVYGNRFTYASLGRVGARLEPGARVAGGVVLGEIGASGDARAPHVDFAIRPSGRGAPQIDPKPILDGWKLLEATAIYRANGENVLRHGPTIGQILLLSKPLLQERVLADERIQIYDCGRADIEAGRIDRRVLAVLAYLSESGLRPTVTSLTCGHAYYTKSGSVSHHSSGNAVDIARINGIPVLGNQEPGGIVDQTVRRLAQLQGAFRPVQIISLFAIGGSTLAMSDHHDHIHVGFEPAGGSDARAGVSVLRPEQWSELVARLRDLPNPVVAGHRAR